MKRNTFPLLVMLGLMLITMMACNLVSNLRQGYEESRDTVQSVATLARGIATEHPGLLETAGSIVSEQGPRLASTAQSFATQHPGLLETAGSIAAEEGPRLANTAESFATQNPGLLETAAALVEEQGGALLGTAQALATERPELLETAKALLPGRETETGLPDIPMPSSYSLEILYNTREALSYSVEAGLTDIVLFYKSEMPAYGWELDLGSSFEGQNMSSLRYSRPDRFASVTISSSSALERTLVVIYTDDR
jgi:hypothetical protein